MGLKKYEIITVGSDKRVRALRSWKVQDRYVNIGDVGGIVYDEKTLSQDGACWLFRGNFNFPGARIGGDSIVDVGEEAPDANSPTPDLNILGSSAVVGSKVRFSVTSTTADAVTLTANDFEQGGISYSVGTNWETWKAPSANIIRTKAPIFMGGKSVTLKVDVPGYEVQAYVMDRDGMGLTATAVVSSGEGVTLAVPAGQYMVIKLTKDPVEPIVPADATAAQITFTGAYKNTLNIIDSRVSINPVTDTASRLSVTLGGNYAYALGGEFPPCSIVGSTVNLTRAAATSRSIYLAADVENSNVSVNATSGNVAMIGVYSNVKNLVYDLPGAPMNVAGKNSIQAYNCDNMVVNTTNFPGLTAMQTAGVPIKFYSCNLNAGRFYHHAQIANTYRDINFDLATKDLGKTTANVGVSLVSSEVNGMYRLYGASGSGFGCLVENLESVKSAQVIPLGTSYNTTIYKDAYFKGLFDIAGTNVFGHKVRSHPLAQVLNVQPRAVQGAINASAVGQTVTGIVQAGNRVIIPFPLRVNGGTGLRVDNIPAGIECNFTFVTPLGVVTAFGTWTANSANVAAAQLNNCGTYVSFRKADNTSAITPEDLAGVTVTVYNGCKLVNTGETAVNMKGNIRVEDNATLIDTSVTGSGYFGGKAVASGLLIEGSVFMSDNAKFTKTAGGSVIRNLKMTDNGQVVLGGTHGMGVLSVTENARLQPTSLFLQEADLIMSGNALVTAGLNISGILRLKDNAKVTAGNMTAKGDITLCGSYNQTVSKVWTGKRAITDVNEPEYDNNVKTQYDF